MTQKEINQLLNPKTTILFLKKKSDLTFWEVVLENMVSLIAVIFFVKRKKFDYLIVTEQCLIISIRNNIYKKHDFTNLESIYYNGNNSTLEIIDQDQQFLFPLHKLRISYEEAKLIHQQLSTKYQQLTKRTNDNNNGTSI